MARTSRKRTAKPEGLLNWKTGLYVRLSVEDNGRKGKDSVGNQLELLKNFAGQYEWLKVEDCFVDNGQSGTDFERPEWERLMADIRKRRINCVIVKDLSRFARNYLEAGDYLQKIFPFMGVRLIAVNDRYDSRNELFPEKDLIAEFRNLANDQYSRDISRKVLTAFQTKRASGEFIGSKAPYGYILKDGKLIVDEPAAAVVRRIFDMRIKGISAYQTARTLNEEEIPSPSVYAGKQGCKKYRNSSALWQTEAVSKILYDRVYAGDLVLGKYNCSIYSMQKQRVRKEAEWEVVENAHQAIVGRPLFEQVQRIREQNRKIRQDRLGNPSYKNVLEGICICGICKRKMRRMKDLRKGKARYYFYCASQTLMSQAECDTSSVADYKIFDLVLKQIRLQAELAVETERVIDRLKKSNAFAGRLGSLNREAAKLQSERARYLYLKTEIYEDFKKEILIKEEFLAAKEIYAHKLAELERKLEDIEIQKARTEQTAHAENKWLQAFLQFRDGTELTREMAEMLLDKVEVYGDKRVHITFRFQNEQEALLSQIKESEAEANDRKAVSG